MLRGNGIKESFISAAILDVREIIQSFFFFFIPRGLTLKSIPLFLVFFCLSGLLLWGRWSTRGCAYSAQLRKAQPAWGEVSRVDSGLHVMILAVRESRKKRVMNNKWKLNAWSSPIQIAALSWALINAEAVDGKSINYGRRTFVICILNKWNTLALMLTKPDVLLQGAAGNLPGPVKLDAHTRLETQPLPSDASRGPWGGSAGSWQCVYASVCVRVKQTQQLDGKAWQRFRLSSAFKRVRFYWWSTPL